MSTPVVDHRAPAGTGAHAGAAPLAARVLRQAGYETGTALRNGEQLLVTVVLPLLALVGVHVTGLLDAPGRSGLDVAVPGVLALAVPLRNMQGRTVAALNVVASPQAHPPETLKQTLLPLLQEAAREVRALL